MSFQRVKRTDRFASAHCSALHFALLCTLGSLGACSCGASSALPVDDTADVDDMAQEAQRPDVPDVEGDVAFDAGPDLCERFDNPDRACISGGEFWAGAVIDADLIPAREPTEENLAFAENVMLMRGIRAVRVALPAFAIDLYEVSVAEFSEYVAATGAPPPPPECPVHSDVAPACVERVADTGWEDDGMFDPSIGERAVACLDMPDAEGFCAWRGGRLPTAIEWMKAARGPLPNTRHYPGAEGTEFGRYGFRNPVRETFAESAFFPDDPRYCESPSLDFSGPFPVRELPELDGRFVPDDPRSPYGLFHMVGNVAEFVRPDDAGGLLPGYANVVMMDIPQRDGSPLGGTLIHGANGTGAIHEGWEREYLESITGPSLADRWVGFRCAYDLE